MHLGLQTITWGDPQHERMGEIIATAAACGYQGIEVGWRRLAQVDVAACERALEEHGLRLIATHAGGNLDDPDQARGERSLIEAMLERLVAWGAPYLMYSGLRYESDAQLADSIAALNTAAERCRERGVRLLYHNHDFEFAHDARAYRALVEQTTPALGFCPDVGWLHKAGADWRAVLDELADRIDAVHYKDFVTADPGDRRICRLGTGCVPLDAVTRWLAEHPRDDIWLIAEQDHCQGSPEDAVAHNATFLHDQIGAHA